MSKRLLVPIALVALTLGFIIFFSTQKGTLVAELNTLSTVRDDVKLYIANKKYPGGLDLPLSTAIRPGKYEIIVLAPGAVEFRETIVIRSGQTTKLSVTLTKDTQYIDQQEITPSSEELANNKYLNLFPYTAKNFSISAKLSRDENKNIIIDRITITPFLPVSAGGGFNPLEVKRAKEQYVNEARAWLKEQGVPDSIPTTIDSAY